MALLLYGVLALVESRAEKSAWLLGAAAAVQPHVVLAIPLIVVVLEPRRMVGYLIRAASPCAVLIGAALDRELASHLERGGRTAQLADGRPPDPVDRPGASHGKRGGIRRSGRGAS